ncbi:unnamed protein product [Caenorhabditis auriculariae]|uniref:Uncharacterized protein n=1 Tax=Caenorhabditis auriculariae TaxID=2777116 RepID=A0A8S1HLE7_9PELO|nr:unnamed protein product [Caenorhabditis auriculariae]
MFLAIINDSYVEVKAELARKKDGTGVLDWVMSKVRRMMKRGKKPDAPTNDITYEDYKVELIRAGYDEKDINEAFTKYNIESSEAVSDKMMEDLGVEMTAIMDRNKNYTENHKDYIVMNRRVDQIESSIISVVDQIDAVLEKLNKFERDKVRVKEQENRLAIESIFANELRQRQVQPASAEKVAKE